jgi:putative ABC transport system ATP-binding protein
MSATHASAVTLALSGAGPSSAAPAADRPLAIDVQHLRFAWPGGPPLLSIGRFAVARGERVFLRGPSGSGKSTLLGLIGGVLQPSAGSVRLLGTDTSRLAASARDRFRGEHLGFVFQMFNLIPYLGVLQNVMLPALFSPTRARRIGDPAALRAEALRLLGALGLGGSMLEREVTQLSIGQQQRVAAARALLGRPEIIIADEPTSSLDYDAREHFLRLLMDECRAQGTTLLFVSHDTSLGGLFDRVDSLADLNEAAAGAATPT